MIRAITVILGLGTEYSFEFVTYTQALEFTRTRDGMEDGTIVTSYPSHEKPYTVYALKYKVYR